MAETTTAYRPTTVSPPGETLEELLEERGLSQAELAVRMGRPTKTVNEIIKGKAGITPETALQLERVLGAPAQFWLTREASYREWLARREDEARLSEDVAWLKELPLGSMVKLGWISKAASRVGQVAAALRFFGVSSVAAWREQYVAPLAAFRTSTKVEKKVGAVAAWLRQGEIEAGRVPCAPFDKAGFTAALARLRALTLEEDPDIFVPKLVGECASQGVAVVLVPTLAGCPASGATRWASPEKAILQLSLRYRSNDHLWFTFFHEAAHLLLHGKKILFLEGAGLDGDHEAEADRFARDFLIPPADARRLRAIPSSEAAVRQFASELGISPGLVVGRMQKEEWISWAHLNGLKVRYTWKQDADSE